MLTLCGLIRASDLRLCFLAITKEGATKFSWKFTIKLSLIELFKTVTCIASSVTMLKFPSIVLHCIISSNDVTPESRLTWSSVWSLPRRTLDWPPGVWSLADLRSRWIKICEHKIWLSPLHQVLPLSQWITILSLSHLNECNSNAVGYWGSNSSPPADIQ